MKSKYFTTIITFFFFLASFSQQKDTIYGKVKKIREKVEFLTLKENPQLLYYDDYGHSGFMGPESTISRFKSIWYSTEFCYYINYERHFNYKGNILEEIWFTKKDSFLKSYKYKYDKKERLVIKIDSISGKVYTDNHYYENDKHENIISQNSDFNYFTHKYKRYNNEGKLVRLKSYDEYGTIDEYIYKYSAKGKLLYRIYKNPNSWRKTGKRSWSYGVQDSIGSIYKDLVNEYDKSNRLIKSQQFDLYEDDETHKEPKLTRNTIYKYNNDNLTQLMSNFSNGKPNYINYVYDNHNNLIEKYCCSKKITNSDVIEKYVYKNDKIVKLEYTEESFQTKETKTYKVSYKYKYDNKGNWREILKKVNGKELYKWVREIEYYE